MTEPNTKSESPDTQEEGKVAKSKKTGKKGSKYDLSPKSEAELAAQGEEPAGKKAKKSAGAKAGEKTKETPKKASDKKATKAKPTKAKEKLAKKAKKPEAEEKPSSGQSGPKLSLEKGDLNDKEAKVLASIRRAKNGITLSDLAERTFPKSIGKAKGNSWTRNSLRRLIRARLVKKMGRGEYIANKAA